MKVQALRQIHLRAGLGVFEECQADIALTEVIEKKPGVFTPLAIKGIAWSAIRSAADAPVIPFGPIALKDEARVINGTVLVDSMSALIDFTIERVDPTGPGAISRALRLAADGQNFSRIRLEEQFNRQNWRRQNHDTQDQLPIIDTNSTRIGLAPLESADQDVYGCQGLDNRTQCCALADVVEVSGAAVPICKFVKALQGEMNPDPSQASPMQIMTYDGKRHDWYRALEFIPLDLIDDIDQRGALYDFAAFDLYPFGHLKPRCLVRVPGREEMKTLAAAIRRAIDDPEPPHPLLERPGLAFDSFYPIPLDPRLPIIDHPQASLWFIARTVRGVFVPQQLGRSFPLRYAPQEASYQVICNPSRP